MKTENIFETLPVPDNSDCDWRRSRRSAALRHPVTIIGGQTLCLLLTLTVTPVTYSLLSELSELKVAGALKASRLEDGSGA